MDYLWIIEIDIFCSIVLSIVLYSLCKNYDRQTRQRYYIKAIITGLVTFAAEINSAIIDGKVFAAPRFVNWLMNSVYFVSSVVMGYYWLCYVEVALESNFIKQKHMVLLAKLPVAIAVIGVIASYFSGFFFYIDSSNVYRRGHFILLHTIICHAYTIITTAHAFIKSLKCKVYLKAVEYRILSMFLLFPFSIGIIQMFFPKIPTVSSGITLAFLYVYIDLQNLLISVDTLSGLNNRNQLLRYLGARLKNNPQENRLYVFMLDVNKFKKINDVYGHIEGDSALIRCSNALKLANRDTNNFIGRYGGDEFILISDLQNDGEAELLCEKIRKVLQLICIEDKVEYDLSFSFGYVSYKKEMKTIQSFIAAADQKLYEAKKARDA